MVSGVQSDSGYDEAQYYERLDWVHLNQDLLGFGNPVEDHPAPHQILSRDHTRKEMQRKIAEVQADHADWGFKDPRTCLTYPIWREVLPEHMIVGVYRSLGEFWAHQARASGKRRSLWKAIRTWTDYNVRLADILERRRELGQPFVLLRYENLMTSDEDFGRFEEFMGRRLDDCRNPDLYRSRRRGTFAIAIADWLMNAMGRPQPSQVRRRLGRLIESAKGEGAG